ncbi:MAG TPA: class I SAM-dependent methyltransferase [Rhizomicrobium sp.]|nr:class I SAM-dependent methyltransferase [Rhizomicrobium sp.]
MRETSKSIMRRLHDVRFAVRYFVGDGIDIGGGEDPLGLYRELFPAISSVRNWDLPDGDAQAMAGVPDNSFDFVHSSHCLEHLNDPLAGLANWLRILKPGGHLIVVVPDEDLYEQGRFPSAHNFGHKYSFTIHKAKSWSKQSISLTSLLAQLGPTAQLLRIELLDATYRFALPPLDQTMTPIGECAIEFIIRKRPAHEIAQGGRAPSSGQLSPDEVQTLIKTGL